jgi:hypothetical protein
MLHNAWTLLAEDFMVDRYSDRHVLTNPIHCVLYNPREIQQDEENPEINWAQTSRIVLMTQWTRLPENTPTTGRGRFTLVTPQNKSYQMTEYEIDLREHPVRYGSGRLHRLQYDGPGVYYLLIEGQEEGEERWRKMGVVPFIMKTVDEAKEEIAARERGEKTPEPNLDL